jgi:hypothetical protein
MGLQVTTNFDTPQGFHVASVYVHIGTVILSSIGSTLPTVTAWFEAYVSREKRLSKASILTVPAMPTTVSFTASLTDAIRFEVLYAHVKRTLEKAGFACQTVLEDGQTAVEFILPVEEEVAQPPIEEVIQEVVLPTEESVPQDI